ncbi:unnamed protein product [Ambrosiozyma monospora]|uniref:Unnamed protein product n=1 Tax=Ambrosiozyma monospora TaxID=43982 RepID=A0ACB5T5M0_AMBMO|nr:unnamed protein product [Ambrosiozyma monospora]
MSELQLSILKTLGAKGSIPDSSKEFPSTASQTVLAALNSLAARSMITYKTKESEVYTLTKEAEDIISHGSHEYRLLNKVLESLEGLKISEVDSIMGKNGKVAQGRAFKNGWIGKDGDKLVPKVSKDDSKVHDITADQLKQIQTTGTLSNKKDLNELKKRKLIVQSKVHTYAISKAIQLQL